MVKKRPPRHAAAPRPSRRGDAGIAEIPTFRPDQQAPAAPATPADPDDDDAVNDAVRRMVEAAYT